MRQSRSQASIADAFAEIHAEQPLVVVDLKAKIAEQAATIAILAKDRDDYRREAEEQASQIERLTAALTIVDSLAQAGLNADGKRIYDSQNELAIVMICQSAGAPTIGRRFIKKAALTKEAQP